jgi:hypothetical protein
MPATNPKKSRKTDHLGLGTVLLMAILTVSLYLITALILEADARRLADRSTTRILSVVQEPKSPQLLDSIHDEILDLATSSQHTGVWHELLLHISVSLFVATILLVVVEFRARRINQAEMEEYRRALSDSVWSAVAGQIVPKEIVTEMNRMLHFKAVRRGCVYRVTLKSAPRMQGAANGEWILVQRLLTYVIEKLPAEGAIPHTINSKFEGSSQKTDANGVSYPRFTNFVVANKAEPFTAHAVHKDETIGDEAVAVVVEAEELYEREDSVYYMQSTPAIGLTVDVANNLADDIVITAVDLTNTDSEQQRKLQPLVPADAGTCWTKGVWHYPGAVLPGQGFSVSWKKKPRQVSQGPRVESEGGTRQPLRQS